MSNTTAVALIDDDEEPLHLEAYELLEEARATFMHAPVGLKARYVLACLLQAMDVGDDVEAAPRTPVRFEFHATVSCEIDRPAFHSAVRALVKAGIIQVRQTTEQEVREELPDPDAAMLIGRMREGLALPRYILRADALEALDN